jgi:hypothetical protein
MRAHPMANILGKTITGYWSKLKTNYFDYYALLVDEWAVTGRLKADTGKNFTSWAEFYGPHKHHNDAFTTTVGFLYFNASPFDHVTKFHSNVSTCRVLF